MKITSQINQKMKTTAILVSIVVIVLLLIMPTPEKQEREIVDTPLDRYFQNSVNFFTELIGNHDRTEIYFPFSFENKPIDIWMGFREEADLYSRKEYLVFHPQIHSLGWDRIVEGEITLYQKTPKYESIEEFLKNDQGVVYADSDIVLEYLNKNFNNISLDMNLNEIDYILTTYIPVTKGVDGVYYYKNILNTKNAFIDDQNSITWGMYAPSASEENAYYRGQIDITYLQ